MEKQFRKYFAIAARTKGVTGKVLLQILERRLDNVVFRMGVGVSRAQARQLVRHNFVYVNSRRVNIPSFQIAVSDTVLIKTKKETSAAKIKENLDFTKDRDVPKWLEFSRPQLSAKIARLPEKEDIPTAIEEQLIVELYSK